MNRNHPYGRGPADDPGGPRKGRGAALAASAAGLLAVFALAGCGGGGPRDANVNTNAGPGPARAEAVGPEEAAVRRVVTDLLEAGRRGDAEAARKLCTPELAPRLANLKPRQIEARLREALVLPQRAKVTVWLKQPGWPEGEGEFLATYRLTRGPGGWKVAAVEVKSYWGE
jgi:hypothetical protein